MIYTKKANFPYPILMNFTDDYKNAEFEFDVTLKDNSENYILEIEWNMSSDFICEKIRDKKASIVLIIKSKDNQFHILSYADKIRKSISKTRLCLNARTVMQLMILSNEDISFADNMDLNDFYLENKDEIVVHKGQALGFSNTVIFDGSQDKPYQLFEKRVDPNIESDIEIELGEETIVIVYKNEASQFTGLQSAKEFNYPYIYLGLQKALSMFILHAADPDALEDGIRIDEMEPPVSALESKLYNLMQAKNVTELSWDNMDYVIYQLSDNMIGRYTDAIRRLSDGN